MEQYNFEPNISHFSWAEQIEFMNLKYNIPRLSRKQLEVLALKTYLRYAESELKYRLVNEPHENIRLSIDEEIPF
ncbi:hypothetical protein A5482_015120 (plasmid) [Cyanobacterium sp. IPPAS B-1200]|uniref:hypothetical protein n=1 Tax=Cyanobacterium sp. IPPAS B-1200 TaxID=1562720 RepID=UPI0008527583|nr:hypothetical protein [Cyanobacterium sp. IPPAS B-1200]OEJ78110.1 hypothetical protein A5482_14130 [Cyanobacterium sp. IPPAS B-1200]